MTEAKGGNGRQTDPSNFGGGAQPHPQLAPNRNDRRARASAALRGAEPADRGGTSAFGGGSVTRPITCTVKRATDLSGLSKNLLYKYIAEKKLGSSVVGGRRLIFVDSLEALVRGGADND